MKLWWIQLFCMLHYTASGFFMKKYFGPSTCTADQETWGYREKNGPDTWAERYPTCNGYEQSPINIKSYETSFNSDMEMLFLKNYEIPVTRGTIQNDGHTIQITPTDGVDRTIFVDGDLYKLIQLHFHWGYTSDYGSEHTINGIHYSMEVHFVHENDKNEVSIIAVFFQAQAKKNTEIQTIVNHFPKVMYLDKSSELNKPINLNNLLPTNPTSYIRYKGSLTTPPCTEGVIWSVLTLPLPIGKDQLKEFRQLYSVKKDDATKHCKLTKNYRPVQPLNKRRVSFSD